MRRILFALPILAAATAFPQASVQTPRPFRLHHVYSLDQAPVYRLNPGSCPVGMTAEQQANGATQWVVSLEDTRNPPRIPPGRMGVHVGLKVSKDRPFREAEVAVSYLVPPTGAMPVGGSAATVTKTFDLFAGDDPEADLESSLLLGSGVSVTRVKLLSITYVDGAVWHPGGDHNCSVRVSHFLPVAAR